MRAQEWTFVDKLEWGAGPWVTEPDRVLWQDEATDYWCLANRNFRVTGSWCGYVVVPQGHAYFNKTDQEYTEISNQVWWEKQHELLMKYGGFAEIPEEEYKESSAVRERHPDYSEELNRLSVHGGVTWAQPNDRPTKQDWQKWRAYMLSEATQQSKEAFPNGDAADEWDHKGHLVDDYEAWHKRQCECTNYIDTDEPVSLIGFDCGHSGDVMPLMDHTMKKLRSTMPSVWEDIPDAPPIPPWGPDQYRTLAYVQDECRSLARQLKELDSGNQNQARPREGQ